MTLEQKLDTLREEWKNATGVDRKVIEQRARLIQWAIEKRTSRFEEGFVFPDDIKVE